MDAPKYKEVNDPFEYIKVVKIIVDKLRANYSRAIQMADFSVKCKNEKEWFKNYEPKLKSLS